MAKRPRLEGIFIGSGISSTTQKPFCHVTVQATNGQFWEAQMDPETVRRMAFDWLEAAEAAIHDAAVYKMLREKMDVSDGSAAQFIAELRNYREDEDRMVDPPAN